MGRIGSCMPWQLGCAAFAPHCWNATSLADPAYVMDATSPSAFCALAMTVLASCAHAEPDRHAKQTAIVASFFSTASPSRGILTGSPGQIGIGRSFSLSQVAAMSFGL